MDNVPPLKPAWEIAGEQGRKLVSRPAMQTTIDWHADGTGNVTEIDANSVAKQRAQRRELLRSDARRTAEYLATRGTTPIEALHDLVKLGWKRGTRELVKELGISTREAIGIYERFATALLPYTAARFDAIELGQGAAAGIGLGHFLAARAVSDLLALERQGATPGGPSIVETTIDAAETPGAQSRDGGETDAIPPTGLPPLAPD